METTNMSNENIDSIKSLVETMDTLIENRNKLIEIGQESALVEADISFGSHTLCVTTIGTGKIIDFLISTSNDRINELKKDISDALYPPTCR